MCVTGWGWACTQKERREKKKNRTTPKSPHTDAERAHHQGPGLKSESPAGPPRAARLGGRSAGSA